MIKLLYKPMGVLVSVLGGVIAGAAFKRVWKVAAQEDKTAATGGARDAATVE